MVVRNWQRRIRLVYLYERKPLSRKTWRKLQREYRIINHFLVWFFFNLFLAKNAATQSKWWHNERDTGKGRPDQNPRYGNVQSNRIATKAYIAKWQKVVSLLTNSTTQRNPERRWWREARSVRSSYNNLIRDCMLWIEFSQQQKQFWHNEWQCPCPMKTMMLMMAINRHYHQHLRD